MRLLRDLKLTELVDIYRVPLVVRAADSIFHFFVLRALDQLKVFDFQAQLLADEGHRFLLRLNGLRKVATQGHLADLAKLLIVLELLDIAFQVALVICDILPLLPQLRLVAAGGIVWCCSAFVEQIVLPLDWRGGLDQFRRWG